MDLYQQVMGLGETYVRLQLWRIWLAIWGGVKNLIIYNLPIQMFLESANLTSTTFKGRSAQMFLQFAQLDQCPWYCCKSRRYTTMQHRKCAVSKPHRTKANVWPLQQSMLKRTFAAVKEMHVYRYMNTHIYVYIHKYKIVWTKFIYVYVLECIRSQ